MIVMKRLAMRSPEGEIHKEGKKKATIIWNTDNETLVCAPEGFEHAEDFIYSMLIAIHSTIKEYNSDEELGDTATMILIVDAATRILKAMKKTEKVTTEEVIKELKSRIKE